MSTPPVVILTGASRGLGLAVLNILLAHGARVVTLSRSLTPELTTLGDQHPNTTLIVEGDVAKIEDNARVVEAAVNKWGRLDSVILNAGTLEPIGKLADVPADKMTPYVEANLLSVIYMLQAALPQLRTTNGRVVMVSSGASARGYQAWGLYSMVKAGMNSLCRTLAVEEKGAVSTWAIRPGLVNTDMQAQIRSLGPGKMADSDMPKFMSAFEKGELLAPELPGSVIAGLALKGPTELSGEYLDWADERLAAYKLA